MSSFWRVSGDTGANPSTTSAPFAVISFGLDIVFLYRGGLEAQHNGGTRICKGPHTLNDPQITLRQTGAMAAPR